MALPRKTSVSSYDETMERVSVDERAATHAITIWDEGPDALRYPDLEPLDLHERDTIS